MLLSLLLLLQILLVSVSPSVAAATGNESVSIDADDSEFDTGQSIGWNVTLAGLDAGGYTLITEFYQGYSNNGTLRNASSVTIPPSGSTQIVSDSIYGFLVWNGTYEYTLRVELWDSAQTNLLAADEVEMIIFQHTIPISPSKFIVFGDSLSDMGNSYNSIARLPQSPPNWNGRFSDGPIWAELVAQGVGHTISHGGGSSSSTNRAYGGARSGGGYTSFVIPNTGTQVNEYTNNYWLQQTDLAVIWIGGNDFLGGGQQNPQVVVNNIADHVTVLNQNGGQQFLILDMPSLERTPNYADESDSDKQAMHARMLDYNSRLANDMAALSISLSVSIQVIGMLDMFETMVRNGSFYGITNPTDRACDSGEGLCEQGDAIVPNPEEYIFFDGLHPTATTHLLVANYVLEQINTPDTDGDGVEDSSDLCPNTPVGDAVNHLGCRLADLDSDNDGVNDADDRCPNTPDGATVDQDGCAESQIDDDEDGVMNDVDACPNTPIDEQADVNGCSASQRDTDGDGVTDDIDDCPGTDPGAAVNVYGCADNQMDYDWDGVMNDVDICPFTPSGESVDPNGCSLSQLDGDGDGVTDDNDTCPLTPTGEVVDARGCSLSQLDGDSDGVSDALDECPLTPLGEAVDARGCAAKERDTDGDGRMDDVDECVELPGSIRGCPILSIEVSSEQPETTDASALLNVTAACEQGCNMSLSIAGEPLTDIADGESVMVHVERPSGEYHLTVEVRIDAGSTWASSEEEINWPLPDVPPDDVVQPEPDAPVDGSDSDSANGEQSTAADDKGWEASGSMVQLLMAAFFLVCIIAVLGMIIRQSRGARTPKQEDWFSGPVASTIEVERDLRTAVQPVAPKPELFTNPAPAQQIPGQPHPAPPTEQPTSDGLPSIEGLFE